jgi:hypothetical protein
MAKKELVESIVKLYSKLGGNIGDVLGSRSNITFLGTGKNPEPFVDMSINMDAVSALGKSKILDELKSPMGYLTADKLNDIQAGKLYENMLKLDNFYNPKDYTIPNITDMATGTRNLDAKGLGALREKTGNTPLTMPFLRNAEGVRPPGRAVVTDSKGNPIQDSTLSQRLAEAEGVAPEETILPMGRMLDDLPPPGSAGGMDDIADKRVIEQMYRTAGPRSLDEDAGYLAEFIADDAGKVLDDLPIKEQTKFIERAKNALRKNVKQYQDLPPPGSRGGPDDIAAPFASAEDTLKNIVTNKGNAPAKRASAREFLVEALKADDTFTTRLQSVIDADDLKYITEGGGGVAGDPLVLVEKYFGPRIAEMIPVGATGEEIITFTRRVIDNVEDAAGLKPDNPRFDRFTARFIDEMAQGGRAGFMAGGIGKFTKAQVLIERLKNTIKDSKNKTDELSVYVNETFPGFIKEIKANPKLAENENVWKTLGLDLPKDQRLVVHSDDTVDFFRQTKFGPHNIKNVEKFMAEHPFLSREDALRILKMEPEDRVLEITKLKVLNNRTKNANGGLAKILEA